MLRPFQNFWISAIVTVWWKYTFQVLGKSSLRIVESVLSFPDSGREREDSEEWRAWRGGAKNRTLPKTDVYMHMRRQKKETALVFTRI